MNAEMNAPVETKKKKRFGKKEFDVEFEDRTPFWERVKTKYLSMHFLMQVVWAIFRYVLLIGIAYVILYP